MTAGPATHTRTALLAVVGRMPGRSSNEYTALLQQAGIRTTMRSVNQVLYYSGDFRNDGGSRLAWFVRADREEPTAAVATLPRQRAPSEPTTLRPSRPLAVPQPTLSGLTTWQWRARDAWYAAGGRGIVEAVTGSGKTWVGLSILWSEVRAGRKALVVVPSAVLMRQWADRLAALMPGVTINRLSSDRTGVSPRYEVTVAVANAARALVPDLTFVDTVIADECHDFGAPRDRQLLLPWAHRRLGLTAALDPSDEGLDEVLRPYFGATVMRCGFGRAYDDELLAHARIALVAVDLGLDERLAYDDGSTVLEQARDTLTNRFGAEVDAAGELSPAVRAWAADPAAPERHVARTYVSARRGIRELLATAAAKTALVTDLAPLVATAEGTLVFSERTGGADEIDHAMRSYGLRSATYHSRVGRDRAATLNALGHGLDVLCTARSLDEGIDVPDVDLGIIAAGTQQSRTMIQRLGRVLRRKPDDREARFVIAYVRGVAEEDPYTRPAVPFMHAVAGIRGDVRHFEPTDLNALMRFLAPAHSVQAARAG